MKLIHKTLSSLCCLSLTLSACAASPMALRPLSPSHVRPVVGAFSPLRRFSARRDVKALIQRFHRELAQRSPELIALKYQAMKESPFVFYRATAFLFYHDIQSESALNQGVKTSLQGDFHLENMGTYRSGKGHFAYDLNDFDEAFVGPHSWDLARLAVSIHLAADEVGIKASERRELISFFLQRYLKHLERIQAQPQLLRALFDERFFKDKIAEQVQQARSRFDRQTWLNEITPNGRFEHGKKIRPISAQEREAVKQALSHYAAARRESAAFVQLKDAAMRVAGKGSLGRYRYDVRVEGPSAAAHDDLILEIKEAAEPSASWAGIRSAGHQGERIVSAYRRFLPDADPYLGATEIMGAPAYIRELLPKETVNLDKVDKRSEYEAFLDGVALIIARAHAQGAQAQTLHQSTAELLPEIQSFADRYHQQVVADFQSFR